MKHERIDWSQLWYPGPTRVFTPAELARAGGDAPSRTLVAMALINMALLSMAVLQAAPPRLTALLTGLLAAAAVAALLLGRRLWRDPTRRRLTHYSVALGGAAGLLVGFSGWRIDDSLERRWAAVVCVGAALLVTLALLFIALYRAHQIAARLAELDERERRADMARQLAQAQIQPHFLFNSLASLQHWVQTKDDRAAPLLDALGGFLRATLPLFDRRLLRVDEEADAVRQYLAVMQLRLGQRLTWSVNVEPAAAAALLPPGLLLTLVENAIEHGVQRSLAGAEVRLHAQARGTRLAVEVRDSGPGPAAQAGDGVGLANARARLAQAFGADAVLTLSARPEGGCSARIECPFTTTSLP
jgi:hypothetical protein